MKLWHDDIRPAPEGWTWARTNETAKHLLVNSKVDEISLDHDLGMHYYSEIEITDDPELIFKAGTGNETGLDLVHWMVETGWVPPKVTIHSWNPAGAERMAAVLNEAGHDVIIAPFKVV